MKGTHFQTQIIDNNLNPKWHHTQPVCINRGGTLEFQVWDSNTKPLPDQLLGEAKLDTENFLFFWLVWRSAANRQEGSGVHFRQGLY